MGEVEQISSDIGIIHEGRLRFQGSLSDLCGSVRRIVWADGHVPTLSPGFECLRNEGWENRDSTIARAPGSEWDGLALPADTVLSLSLEEIFLAYARTDARV